jgi:hypothetical protein
MNYNALAQLYGWLTIAALITWRITDDPCYGALTFGGLFLYALCDWKAGQ